MRGRRQGKSIREIGFCLFLLTFSSAFAEQPKKEEFPSVEHASFHHLVFADQDIAVLNNLYPPDGDSGFHTHYHDLFYVVIQPAESRGQGVGKPLTAGPKINAGAAGLSAVGDKPRTHRIINGSKGNLQIIVVELRRSSPLGEKVSLRGGQYTQIFDNSRLRAWRLILLPGQSTTSISQVGKEVRVVVRGGQLTTTAPGLPDQVLFLNPGDFSVQPAGLVRALANHGNDTIELVEIELK